MLMRNLLPLSSNLLLLFVVVRQYRLIKWYEAYFWAETKVIDMYLNNLAACKSKDEAFKVTEEYLIEKQLRSRNDLANDQ